MIFETHQLSAPLEGYIESVFHFKGFTPDHSIERVVPTGHIFIIFELDDMVRNTFHNDTLKPKNRYQKAWISGAHRNYISISAHENSEMFVIQFKPFGAYPFLHFSLDEISEKVIDGEQVLDGQLFSLREELLRAKESNDKFEVATTWLLDRFETDKTPPEELVQFYEKLQEKPTTNGHRAHGVYPRTQKHLIQQFKKYVGLTPKYAHRIVRFNEILQRIQKKEKISWASIAYECGFSDQSYFIKEFKHFSGFNPQEFIDQDRQHDEPNFFPLDR